MPATAENTNASMELIAPDTGEILNVNLDAASVPESTDTREAINLGEIKGAFMIFGVRFSDGKNFEGEYAEVAFARERRMELGITSSKEVIGTLRRMVNRGLCSQEKPAIVKTAKARTSSGYTVHKLQIPEPAEVATLQAALKG